MRKKHLKLIETIEIKKEWKKEWEQEMRGTSSRRVRKRRMKTASCVDKWPRRLRWSALLRSSLLQCPLGHLAYSSHSLLSWLQVHFDGSAEHLPLLEWKGHRLSKCLLCDSLNSDLTAQADMQQRSFGAAVGFFFFCNAVCVRERSVCCLLQLSVRRVATGSSSWRWPGNLWPWWCPDFWQ